MSFDYVVDHAQKHVWCVPKQDMQSIIQPQRLTPLGGGWNTVQVMWRTISLPLPNVHFHVYQFSSLDPRILGLLANKYNTWQSFSNCMNKQRLIVDIYAATGVQMPRYACWYLVTRDGALVVAVQFQPTIAINLDTDDLFFRFYSNAYYQSIQSTPDNDFISTAGMTCLNQNAILTLQHQFEAIQAQMTAGTLQAGEVYAFVNGWRVSGIDLFTATVGDCVEYVYDSSIFEVIDIPVSSMQTFQSTLDSKLKYLLHYAQPGDNSIDYQDDIDVFLYQPGTNGRWSGLYYHRNAKDAMRMVTHKDYSIPTTYVQAYATQQPTWGNIMNLVARLHIRKGGWLRPLVFENNRIQELYKLPDADIVQAMIGVNATVPNWTADTLESAGYTKIMRTVKTDNITNALVQNAYGYNAISKILGDTPQLTRVSSGQTIADVPYALVNSCTGFEYDANGLLIGFFQHPIGSTYVASTAFAKLVELFSGQGGSLLDETYGLKQSTAVPGANYRFYTCPINSITGLPTYVWTDVTGSSQYSMANGQVTWLIDTTKFFTLVRGDQRFLAYSISIPPVGGVLEFTLAQRALRLGQLSTIEMEIPMGELQLWLNNHALVESIDYIVDFPKIVITNKKYLQNVATQAQNIAIRFAGFCNTDLSREMPDDVGWIKYGRLSDNNRYDVRDDRVMSFIASGMTYDRSELTFQEDDGAVLPVDAINGTPYQIRDIVVPLEGLVAADTYSLRAQSQLIDKAVSDYLTSRLNETDPTGPSTALDLWAVYSPFFCNIMNDLLTGVFVPPFLMGQYSDQQVVDACAPYTYLLAFDQTQDAHAYDPNYMIVHPHNLTTVVTVSIYIYKFMRKVNSLFLHNKINLSPFINIATIT